MTKLNHRTTGTNGVEWQAVGPDGEPFGPWRPNQHDARKDDPLNGQAVPQPDGYSGWTPWEEKCPINLVWE